MRAMYRFDEARVEEPDRRLDQSKPLFLSFSTFSSISDLKR